MCGSDDSCPSDYVCGSDRLCHRAPYTSPDAAVVIDAMPDVIVADIAADLAADTNPALGDVCANPAPLASGVSEVWSTTGESNDYSIQCVSGDSADRVHQLVLGTPQATLITIQPLAPSWPLIAALRNDAACTANSSDVSCVAGAFDTRYINRPNLAAGTYDVIVDGTTGTSGGYSIRWDTRAVDTNFGYWRMDHVDSPSRYTPISGGTAVAITTAADGTGINGPADEGYYQITLPFTFDFFGTAQTSIYAQVNGFLSFITPPNGASAADSYTIDCPLDGTTPFDLIAPFWSDSFATSNAPASTLTTKTEGTAPFRRFIIEYANFESLYSNKAGVTNWLGDRVSHQAILYENGDIEFRYGPRTAPTVSKGCGSQHLGCSATIGLRNVDSSQIYQDRCTTTDVTDGTVVYFVHPR
jgi:hypothetical protein